MPTNNDSIIGKILQHKYRVDGLLAKGGQGSIYYATDISSSIAKQYIIKKFVPNYSDDYLLKVGSRLFKQESQTLQKLGNHPQIPQIFDYFEVDKHFYLVQEKIEGQDLEKEFTEKQQLKESEARDLLKDILEVLNFVHLNRYIHRDIKPSNLIRSKHGGKIYLIDFGAVKEKILPENIGKNGQSNPTIVVGTNGYMPNEQRMGHPELCSDIYAVGMVVVKALTGVDPSGLDFDRDYNPLWRDRLPLSSEQYDANFLQIIDKMVRHQCRDRYQSVAEAIQDLDKTTIQRNTFNSESNLAEDFKLESKTVTSTDSSEIEPEETITKTQNPLNFLVMGGSAIALGAIGLLLLAGNIFSTQYRTYENAEYGIELKYPDSWSIQEHWMSLQPEVRFIAPDRSNGDKFQEKVIISVEDLTTPLSLNQYTTQSIAEIELYNQIITRVQPTTFANKEGRKIIYQAKNSNQKHMQVWTIKNQKAYLATYTAEAEDFDKYSDRANKIVETFVINN